MGVAEQQVATNPDLDAARIDTAEFAPRSAPVPPNLRERRFQTVFRQPVLDDIHRHGKETTDVEVCGVLVGNVHHDSCGPWLYVESSIRGDAAEGHATQVTFKAETWEYIQREMETKHPDKRIVGWYHTHPGFGIFLSGMDLFIQDNFFNLSWQIAFVYDPVGGDEGAFVWRGGKSEREPFLIDETMKSSSVAQRDGQADVSPTTGMERVNGWLGSIDPSKPWTIAVLGVVITFVLVGLWFALSYGH